MMTKMTFRMTAAIAGMAGLSACAWQGGDIGDPAARKFHWFSFVAGDDIRANCKPGLPDRYRLVYNGIYDQQLRIYEVDSLRRLLVIHVTTPGSAARLSSADLLAPWRATEARVQLDERAYADLTAALNADGIAGPSAAGLELPARSYHWTAAACVDARFHFTGWKYPSPAFAALTFDDRLFALDPTGIPVAQPGPIPFDPQLEDKLRRLEVSDFTLKVGRDGLVR